MTSNMAVFKEIESQQLADVEALAKKIWNNHYSTILDKEQIDFMLEKFQSVKAMKEQIKNGYHYVGLYDDCELSGYYAVQEQDEFFFLSKIYFDSKARGKGFLKKAMDDMARFNPTEKPIKLTVNRSNPSIEIYKKVGFEVVSEKKVSIGNGYFMDDYIMVK